MCVTGCYLHRRQSDTSAFLPRSLSAIIRGERQAIYVILLVELPSGRVSIQLWREWIHAMIRASRRFSGNRDVIRWQAGISGPPLPRKPHAFFVFVDSVWILRNTFMIYRWTSCIGRSVLFFFLLSGKIYAWQGFQFFFPFLSREIQY